MVTQTAKSTHATFIFFGASGDLAKRKLLPALYTLLEHKTLSTVTIVGLGRRRITAKELLLQSKPFIKSVKRDVWKQLQESYTYQQLDIYNSQDYQALTATLKHLESQHKVVGPRVFYFATAPQHFDELTRQLAAHKLVKSSSRLVYEKPFGNDLPSARKLNRCINRIFSEKQVYRIDHYLGKELVENIALMRFTNRVLEPQWNHRDIESIQIILNEKVLVNSRGEFYDSYGALKDVVQNHMLQLLALVAMDPPKKLEAKYIRDEKAKVLKKTVVVDSLVAQYEGYKSEKAVAKDSQTETFVALKAFVNTARWKGVPFYLKTGKGLDAKKTLIDLKFKKVDCLLDVCPTQTNHLRMRIQPDEGFSLLLNAKVAGKSSTVKPVSMDFCSSCQFGPNTFEAYATLFSQVLKADHSSFVRADEIEAAWKIIDPLVAARASKKVGTYKIASAGPPELKDWQRKHMMQWVA